MDSTSSLSRSKTMPSLMRPKLTRKITNLGNSDRLKNAKELAEKAIKVSDKSWVYVFPKRVNQKAFIILIFFLFTYFILPDKWYGSGLAI